MTEPQELRISRRKLHDEIEARIALLDILDGDSDLEGGAPIPLGDGVTLVLDADAEDEPDAEDGDPAEPSLGSSAVHGWESQEEWARGTRDDREGDEHDGAEPCQDSEPTLGWNELGRADLETSWPYASDGEGEHEPDAELDNGV